MVEVHRKRQKTDNGNEQLRAEFAEFRAEFAEVQGVGERGAAELM